MPVLYSVGVERSHRSGNLKLNVCMFLLMNSPLLFLVKGF